MTRWHLNVPERAMLKDGGARGSVVVAVISDQLLSSGWFPADWRPDHDFSGGVIERTPAGYRIHWKTEVAMSRFAPLRVSQHGDMVDAAREWVGGMFGDNIDGIRIDWTR